MTDALTALEARVRDDLYKTAHPNMPWLKPKQGANGQPALDVLVVGAGQSGLAIGFGLLRSQVTNFVVLDKAEEGQEGPWLTYARMPTLRSPKHFTGPDLDIPSLTYQSWHEASFGRANWEQLDRIPRGHWFDYLTWFRRMVDVPVRNGCDVLDIAPAENGLLAAIVQSASGTETLYARKIVLATGQEGMGNWIMPEPLRHLPSSLCVTGNQPVDFAALRGKRVVVIGAGASAFDNAATALEAGAEVHLLCRRAEVQTVQPYHWLTFRGFLRHFSDLDDAALALHEDRAGDARGFSAADLGPLRAPRRLSSARGLARRIGAAGRRRGCAANSDRGLRGRLRDLRHRHRDGFRRAARAAELRR